MARSIPDDKKPKRRGRPPTTGTGTLVAQRWHADDLKAIDVWRERQNEQPDRAEAVRRLVRLGLTVKSKQRK